MAKELTFASGTNVSYIESLYKSYSDEPSSVDSSWQQFFAGYEMALEKGAAISSGEPHNHGKIEAFINTYRRLGHLGAFLNPLEPKPEIPIDLQAKTHGIDNVDEDAEFVTVNYGGGRKLSLRELQASLQRTYCGSIGADYRELNSIEAVSWLQEQMETCENQPKLEVKERKRILKKLAEAEGFEKFLQARYLGQKRFSLEGLESLIPLLDSMFSEATQHDVEEVCMGMAHRGRLNVLANTMRKPYSKMLEEFEGSESNPFDIDGDVKYHMGFGNEVETATGKSLRVYLSPNPSHLEAVNPVVVGFTRCRQDLCGDLNRGKIVSILLHGDAAFIGQGIVSETLNLSGLSDYKVGGTIHIITNNQIGFTTNPGDSRSCGYSSDISKMVRAPVFHVNADDPEAVVWVAKLAVRFRQKFGGDVVIDLVGYRRHGHNETDEPSFTQPLMYKMINKKESVFKIYGDALVSSNVLKKSEVEEESSRMRATLQASYEQVRQKKSPTDNVKLPDSYKEIFHYSKVTREEVFCPVQTKLEKDKLHSLGKAVCSYPDTFSPLPKLKKVLKNREKMLENEGAIDWAFGELLAFSSLADEGYHVRLSGQDCKRGTFSSRHGVFVDCTNGESYEPLNHIGQGSVDIVNSPLSEQGCLGFEFGFSVANPNSLVLWEAQFGDFVNGAQIIIDQFLLASEAKWHQTSGLVLLLPHGFEGMGPEHSSARPERFLQGCGNLNIQVCNVTTPSQLFHLLRRQIHRSFRKPLIIMTPKSLLRHPQVRSKTSQFTSEIFHELLDDVFCKDSKSAEKLVLCTGKIYYELLESREKFDHVENVPIIRIEQLYPFPFESLKEVITKKYKNLKQIVWVQEEPQNMGAWNFVRPRIQTTIAESVELIYVGRRHSGSTAEGSVKAHNVEQKRILEEAFGGVCAWDPVQELAERQKLRRL